MRARALAAAAVALAALGAGSAHAENPVLDPEDDAEVVEALAEATALHGVCYGYALQVSDTDTGRYRGTYTVSDAGVGTLPERARCPRGSVVLDARLSYTSDLSEAEDSASWRVVSTLGGPTAADLTAQGLSARDLTDDATSYTALRSAVLALPSLTAAQHGLPPLVLEPDAAPPPAGAVATGSPGSDWLRQNGALLGVCVLGLLGGLLALAASLRAPRARWTGPGPSVTSSSRPPAADPRPPAADPRRPA